MRMSENPIWRRFWHAVMPLANIENGPKPFRLLGEDIVLFLDKAGQPAALRDRCKHRTSRLSKGWTENGSIVCAYHGWKYAADGRLESIPQLGADVSLPNCSVDAYRCQERFGYIWVALDEPLRPILEIAEDDMLEFRRVPQFYQEWRTSPLRLMENSFDNAHFSFVHKGTFGNIAQPKPGRYSIEETDYGFYAEAVTSALNPPAAHRVTGCTEPMIDRTLRSRWYLPFARRFDMEFPSGIRHIIFTYATPIDDERIQVTQFLYRNDSEEDCPAQALINWDAAILAEDKDILEATDPSVPLDVRLKLEEHMPSDRPGLIMRKQLHTLLTQEAEARQPEMMPAAE
jgi:phenylpropionate dioxygenase-like ring-hydroxylating dioxygenase large terminal subunit